MSTQVKSNLNATGTVGDVPSEIWNQIIWSEKLPPQNTGLH